MLANPSKCPQGLPKPTAIQHTVIVSKWLSTPYMYLRRLALLQALLQAFIASLLKKPCQQLLQKLLLQPSLKHVCMLTHILQTGSANSSAGPSGGSARV